MMKSSMKFLGWVALMVLITIGILCMIAVAIPTLIYQWWQEENKARKDEDRHNKFDEVYSGSRAPWHRNRRTF